MKPHQPTHVELIRFYPPDNRSQVAIQTTEQSRKISRSHSRQQLGNVEILVRKFPNEEEIDECSEAEHIPLLGLARV